MKKISIISKTFRIHDNPFLDSDVYIIYINKKEYGHNQTIFLHQIIKLHLLDLYNISIIPHVVHSMSDINKILDDISDKKIYIDDYYPYYKTLPKNAIFVPSWTLFDWTSHIEQIRQWFSPNGLKNHKVFKQFVHKNIRNIYNVKIKKTSPPFAQKELNKVGQCMESIVQLPKNNLDRWIQKKLKNTDYMKNNNWSKPYTCPNTSLKIINNNEKNNKNIDNKHKTSKLSPFIALGVLSPVLAYQFWTGENRMGSSRDQLLFREMFHACGQLPEYWKDKFGDKYTWKTIDKNTWNKYINGNTGKEDVDIMMKQLKNEGWIHHLARHLVADYLTRGTLEYDWKKGMQWFKKTLIDHDEAVNRGNWMWLSGTAFSTKQRTFYHYNPDNYIKNKSKTMKCISKKK
jgi:deoxyribodipyrimidine photolyase